MNKDELIVSGLLELYVLGETGPEENEFIERLSLADPEVRKQLNEIELSLEKLALANAVEPDPIFRPFLLATLDFMGRVKNGESITEPPLLNENSVAGDYAPWLGRADMVLPEEPDDVFAKILCTAAGVMTAIVWLKYLAPQEVHHDEYEKFLILEGTCDIHIEDAVFSLRAGDFLTIPLHKKHHVLVTSEIHCKVILQRVAA